MSAAKIQSLDTSQLTGAELLALATLRQAWKGKTFAAAEVTDRSEGKTPAAVAVGLNAGLDVTAAISEAYRRARANVEERARDATKRTLLALPEAEKPDA